MNNIKERCNNLIDIISDRKKESDREINKLLFNLDKILHKKMKYSYQVAIHKNEKFKFILKRLYEIRKKYSN